MEQRKEGSKKDMKKHERMRSGREKEGTEGRRFKDGNSGELGTKRILHLLPNNKREGLGKW